MGAFLCALWFGPSPPSVTCCEQKLSLTQAYVHLRTCPHTTRMFHCSACSTKCATLDELQEHKRQCQHHKCHSCFDVLSKASARPERVSTLTHEQFTRHHQGEHRVIQEVSLHWPRILHSNFASMDTQDILLKFTRWQTARAEMQDLLPQPL